MEYQAIDLKTYNYHLPDDRIATYPLPQRDHSKLLHYREGSIQEYKFHELDGLLDAHTTLVFNNTKVIPARIVFYKESGARIEIFLLEPEAPSTVISTVMAYQGDVAWRCMIGNAKRWKQGQHLHRQLSIGGLTTTLTATRGTNENQVILSWDNPSFPFVDIVEAAGQVPLPPYLHRAPEALDKPRYQTVYSKNEGAVAAPTAGLHFTEELLSKITANGIKQEYLTLHVSAGTFQPIKVENIVDHPMHSEQIIITRANLENMLSAEQIVAVGTTSMRTLESLYWYGVLLMQDSNSPFFVEKLTPYKSYTELPSWKTAFAKVLSMMDTKSLDAITGATEIFIFPGYKFRVCDGLITNFHQPGSTLILLVAAFVGNDWRTIYDYAIANNFRFLSYGDSSLLWRNDIVNK